jgi:hypothetical protein
MANTNMKQCSMPPLAGNTMVEKTCLFDRISMNLYLLNREMPFQHGEDDYRTPRGLLSGKA